MSRKTSHFSIFRGLWNEFDSCGGTVNGWNPKQPPEIYQTLYINNGISYISTGDRRISSMKSIFVYFQLKKILHKSPGQNTSIADDAGDELQEVFVPPQSNLENFWFLHIGLAGTEGHPTFNGESL